MQLRWTDKDKGCESRIESNRIESEGRHATRGLKPYVRNLMWDIRRHVLTHMLSICSPPYSTPRVARSCGAWLATECSYRWPSLHTTTSTHVSKPVFSSLLTCHHSPSLAINCHQLPSIAITPRMRTPDDTPQRTDAWCDRYRAHSWLLAHACPSNEVFDPSLGQGKTLFLHLRSTGNLLYSSVVLC